MSWFPQLSRGCWFCELDPRATIQNETPAVWRWSVTSRVHYKTMKPELNITNLWTGLWAWDAELFFLSFCLWSSNFRFVKYASYTIAVCWKRTELLSGLEQEWYTVIPRLTKIIRSGITFVSRSSLCYQVSHISVSNVNNRRVGGSPLSDVVSSFLSHTYRRKR